jgi:Flp pilus assembly pilin Flp
MNRIRSLTKDTRGASMVEYVILVGVIAVLALAAFKIFGTSVMTKIQGQGQTVDTQVNTAP